MESELPTREFGYDKYLIVPFWYASAAYQARLVLPWVFWLDCVSPRLAKIRNHGSTKLAWYAAEAYQKGTIRYKNCTLLGPITITNCSSFHTIIYLSWVGNLRTRLRLPTQQWKLRIKDKFNLRSDVPFYFRREKGTPVRRLRYIGLLSANHK